MHLSPASIIFSTKSFGVVLPHVLHFHFVAAAAITDEVGGELLPNASEDEKEASGSSNP